MIFGKDVQTQFGECFEAHNDAIFRHIYFRLGNRERAKELTQEAFCKVWAYVCEGKEVKNLRAFLYTVATNLVTDEHRKKKMESLDAKHEETGFDAPSKDHERTFLDAELHQLRTWIDMLDEPFREVLVLRYVNDLSPREIAGILNESANVISVRIFRATKLLKEQFYSARLPPCHPREGGDPGAVSQDGFPPSRE